MIKKLLLLLVVALVVVNYSEAQTIEELKAQKAEKEGQLGTIQGEVDDLAKLIYEFPGWKFGGVGVVGLDLASNNNWYAIGNPNSSSTGLGVGITGFANLDEDKYFWRNGLNINLNRNVAFTDKDDDNTKVTALSDLLDFSSLFGYKLAPKFALSAELKWLSSLIKFSEGNPDISQMINTV